MSFTLQKPFVDTTNDYTPINDMAIVTPNDGADLPGGTCRGLMLCSGGTITIDTAAGNTVMFTVAGAQTVIFYIRVKRVRATGTTVTAGNIIACY